MINFIISMFVYFTISIIVAILFENNILCVGATGEKEKGFLGKHKKGYMAFCSIFWFIVVFGLILNCIMSGGNEDE